MRSSLRFKMTTMASLAIASACLAADWSVVVGARSGRVVGEHAKVLAETFGKATGEKCTVVDEGKWNKQGPAILIGETAAAREAGLSEKDMPELETYAVRGSGDRYVVNGKGPAGKVFAIYEFLSKALDAEMLDAWTFDVRPADAAKLPALNICRRPDFRRRHLTGPSWSGAYNLGAALKVTTARLPNPQWGAPRACHSFYEYQKHWPKDRKDWLAKDANGETLILTGHSGPCFCLSNREAKDFFKKQLLEYIKSDRVKFAKMGLPAPTLYNVTQNDSCSYFCKCPKCAAVTASRGDSALLLDFINELADAVREPYPEVLIETFAYAFAREPPKDDTRPRDNVVMQVCHTSGNYYAPVAEDSTSTFVPHIRRWAEIARHLSVWDYSSFFWDAFPSVYHNVDKIARDLRFYKSLGTEYLWLETHGEATRTFHALSVYLLAKLADDISQDENRLTERFLTGFYGPAADEMRAYLELTERLQQGKHGSIFIPRAQFYKTPPRPWLDAAFFAQTEKIFARAEAKCAPGSRALFNVRHERIPIDLTILNTYATSGSELPIAAVADRYESNAAAFARERTNEKNLEMRLAEIRSEADCFRRADEIARNKATYRPRLKVPRAPAKATISSWYDNNGFASDRRIVLDADVTESGVLRLSLIDKDAGKAPMVIRDLNGLSDDFEIFLANASNEYVQIIVIPDGRHVVYVAKDGQKARPRDVPAVRLVSSDIDKDSGSWRVAFELDLNALPVKNFTRANFFRSSTTCRFAWAPTYSRSFGVLGRFGTIALPAKPVRVRDFTDTTLQIQLPLSILDGTNLATRLADVRKTKADGLQLICCEFFQDGEARQKTLRQLGRAIRFFEDAGYPVAVWTSSLGYGGRRRGDFARRFPKARQLKAFDGNEAAYCSTDVALRDAIAENVRDFIRVGAKAILFDDDFVQACRPGIGCVCDEHLRRFAARLGRESITAAEIERSMTGAPNRVRTAFFDVMGESLMDFAKAMRAAADSLDPTVNMGLCASVSHYDLDGVDFAEVVRTFAAKGKRPFMRVSGATYWPTGWVRFRYPGQDLGGVLEFVRWQLGLYRTKGFAILDENDTCPRDPEWVPSGMCEIYDKAMIAEGGIIRNKYILRLNRMHPEVGISSDYMAGHLRNLGKDDEIAALFKDAKPVGFRVFMPEHLVRDATLPKRYVGDSEMLTRFSQPMAGISIVLHGTVTQYARDDQPWVVYGAAAAKLPPAALKAGVMVDREGAWILASKGIDVGLGKAPVKTIGAWSLYRNAKGERFAVASVPWTSPAFDYRREGPRKIPVAEIWEFLTDGRPLPVKVTGVKGVYVIAKERPDGTMAVLVCNVCDRPTDEFSVEAKGKTQKLSLPTWGFKALKF